MKKTFLFLMLTMVVSVAFAGGIEKLTASNRMAVIRSGSLFKVFYKGTTLNKVTITIYDESGEKVFADNLGRVVNFVRPYNFSGLKEGAYTIELVDGLGKQVEDVSYHTASTEKMARLIRLKNGASRFMLLVPSTDNGKLTVKVLDGSSRVVYEETTDTTGDFSKIYDLKALSGDFTVEVSDDKGLVKTFGN
jgi:hypothetical protein